MDNLVASYLDRLGLEAERPSLQALTRLHRAHVEHVPYETFWIHLSEGWGVDPMECFSRTATSRRGGYCFQLNSSLHELLARLGYKVSLNPANVHAEGGPEHIKIENHVAIIAEGMKCESNPGGRWWVDVGLGDALHEQVPLMEGIVHQGSMRFGMEAVAADGVGDWHLIADPSCWVAGVSMAEQPVDTRYFLERHHFNVHSPDSGYAKVVTAQLRRPNGKTVLRGCVLTDTQGDIVTTHISESRSEWLDVLRDTFGLTFEHVPETAMTALWVKVRLIHEEWLRSRDSA